MQQRPEVTSEFGLGVVGRGIVELVKVKDGFLEEFIIFYLSTLDL